MVRKVGWYRPADCIGFFPATPRGELNEKISSKLEEEGKRIKMTLRSVEMGGVSLAKQLVRKDLKSGEPCGRPGCFLDTLSGGAGGPNNQHSVLYHGTCNICGEVEELTLYWGEISRSGYHCTLKHEEEVIKRFGGTPLPSTWPYSTQRRRVIKVHSPSKLSQRLRNPSRERKLRPL